jgi:hypothetical protein
VSRVIKSQRRYFPPFDAAYRRARVLLISEIVGRVLIACALGYFVMTVADAENGNALTVILATGAFTGAISLIVGTIEIIQQFGIRVSAKGYEADPRANAAREEGFKAYTEAALKGANGIAAQAAADAAIASYVDRHPSYHLTLDAP